MKKWIAFMLVLFLAVVAIGCGGGETPDPEPGEKPVPPVTEEVKPTEIKVSGEKAEIEVGEEFDLTIEVLPADAKNKNVRVVANPSGIVDIKNNKTVKGLKGGEVTITISSIAAPTVKKEIKLTVKGEEEAPVIINPESFTLRAAKSEVEIGKSLNLSIDALPEGAKKDATWESSDPSIATVNNGVVKGIALGKVTITATSTLVPTVSATYEVTVIETSAPVIIKPESIDISGSETEIYEGATLQLRANVYPDGANQGVIWVSMKPEIATVNEKGLVTGVSEGTAYIYAISVDDEEVQSSKYRLKIKKDNSGPVTYPDMQGYNIVFMINTKFDPYGESYSGLDKLARQQAWTEIQKLYNCVLVEQSFPADASWGPNRHKWIVSQAEVGQAQADFFQVPVGWLGSMIAGNAIADVTSYYAKWGKSQMSPVQKAASTIQGKLYGVSEGTDPTLLYADLGIYYNVGMLERYKIESPAKLFNEGTWNYSTFQKWVESAQALLPEGYITLAGHPYYYWLGLTNAAGVKIADTVKGTINIYNNAPIEAASLLRTIYLSGAYEKSPTWGESDGEFIAGKALCSSGFRWYCGADNRWTPDVWGEDTRFGYVPFPRPDSSSKEATRVTTGGGEVVWTMATQRNERPGDIKEEDLYRVMVDLFRMTRDIQSKDPTFDAEAIKKQVVEKSLDDPESVEAMLYFDVDKAVVDVCHLFFDSISGSPLTTNAYNIVVGGVDYTQSQAEDYETYENKFLSLYGAGA